MPWMMLIMDPKLELKRVPYFNHSSLLKWLESVQIGKCQNAFFFKIGKCRNAFFFKIGKCRNAFFFKIGKCPILTLSNSDTFPILTLSNSDTFKLWHFQILTLSDSDTFQLWHFPIPQYDRQINLILQVSVQRIIDLNLGTKICQLVDGIFRNFLSICGFNLTPLCTGPLFEVSSWRLR